MASYNPDELATAEAPRPEHEAALQVLAEARDAQIQKLEALHREHRDVLQAADRARHELDRQQMLVDSYDRAMGVLAAEDNRKADATPAYAGRPIRDSPQA